MEQRDDSGRPAWRARLPGLLLALLLIGVGVAGLVVASGSRPGSPVVESSGDPGELTDPEPTPVTTTSAPTDPATDPATGGREDDEVAAAWAARDRDATFAELIRLAEEAAATPLPDGVALVAMTHEAVEDLPDRTNDLDEARLVLRRYHYRWAPDGAVEIVETLLGQAQPGDRSLAAYRQAYATAAEIDDVTDTGGAGDPRDLPSGVAERVAEEAGDLDPQTTTWAVHEALQLGWATDELTTWQPTLLAILRDLGPEVVRVDEPLRVLTDRLVVPLVVPEGDTETVWFFDATTGEYAGYGGRGADGWGALTVIERPAPEA